MMALLLRLLLLIALVIIVYTAVQYFKNPKRKLEMAHSKKYFYFLDDIKNVRKNFLITYKGVMFEGEKYLGSTSTSFDVVSISIWVLDREALQGLQRKDFEFMEKEIHSNYPEAELIWKSPIKEFINKSEP
ncbi:sigma-w pathway protein ysdB [Sinobaca sp. H24]|uniref:sigma-w pathway protein ysdB n=1 Tax=Sinobaca sp. H24 TaxID=2923376 RepID=UPI0027E2E6D5|nr:sigma-w pathway protein ysdB [Sinobaca sp. H24]